MLLRVTFVYTFSLSVDFPTRRSVWIRRYSIAFSSRNSCRKWSQRKYLRNHTVKELQSRLMRVGTQVCRCSASRMKNGSQGTHAIWPEHISGATSQQTLAARVYSVRKIVHAKHGKHDKVSGVSSYR